MSDTAFDTLTRTVRDWNLTPDGAPFDTPHAWLLYVRLEHFAAKWLPSSSKKLRPVNDLSATPAVLKVRKPDSEEHHTAALLAYYDGHGAVMVLRADGDATLMERACGTRSLWAMALGGEDIAAADILADTIKKLHAPKAVAPPAGLPSLRQRFQPLFDRQSQDSDLALAAAMAEVLFATPRDEIVLHGDMHHNNVLHDAVRGWLAIDPQGLIGERTYEVANLLRNPWPHGRIVHNANRMRTLAAHYAKSLDLDPDRILRFALAHAGLCVAWDMLDGNDPRFSQRCVEILAPLIETP